MKKTILFFLILSFTAQGFASGEFGDVDIHGFISQGYLVSDENDYLYADTDKGTFEFNEMGINFGTQLNESLRLGMQLFAKDLGEVGNDEVTLDWAYTDWQFRNWLGMWVGKMKKPYGIYNQVRDIDMTRAQIFLPQSIYPEIYRELLLSHRGVGIHGTLPGRIDYQVVYGEFDVDPNGGASRQIEKMFADSGVTININSVDTKDSTVAAIVWNTPISGFSLGATYGNFKLTFNTNEDFPGWVEDNGHSYMASMEYMLENLRLSAEYLVQKLTMEVGDAYDQDIETEDYYVMGSYRFNEWFELGTYYSVSYPSKDDKHGENYDPKEEAWMKDLALSTRFDVNDNWILKLEGHKMNGLRDVQYDENDPEPDWFLFAAKVSYNF